jgi:hypothetical protein
MQNNEHAIQEAMRIAKSSAGQQLLRMLQNGNQDALNKAMQLAANGNYDQAKVLLQQMLSDPQAKELLKKLGDANG